MKARKLIPKFLGASSIQSLDSSPSISTNRKKKKKKVKFSYGTAKRSAIAEQSMEGSSHMGSVRG
jgi:hypothetical protein